MPLNGHRQPSVEQTLMAEARRQIRQCVQAGTPWALKAMMLDIILRAQWRMFLESNGKRQ